MISVLGVGTAVVLYFLGYLHGVWFCIIVPVGLFWFAIPGHGLVYGPHLWLLAIGGMLKAIIHSSSDGNMDDPGDS